MAQARAPGVSACTSSNQHDACESSLMIKVVYMHGHTGSLAHGRTHKTPRRIKPIAVNRLMPGWLLTCKESAWLSDDANAAVCREVLIQSCVHRGSHRHQVEATLIIPLPSRVATSQVKQRHAEPETSTHIKHLQHRPAYSAVCWGNRGQAITMQAPCTTCNEH